MIFSQLREHVKIRNKSYLIAKKCLGPNTFIHPTLTEFVHNSLDDKSGVYGPNYVFLICFFCIFANLRIKCRDSGEVS